MFIFENESATLIPASLTGGTADVKEVVNFYDHGEALRFYKKVCERIKEVNVWHELMGKKESQYRLFSPDGKEKNGPAKQGDYIRFNTIPPSPEVQELYWVRIDRIINVKAKGKYCFGMRVKPSPAPKTANAKDTSTTVKGSSTFIAEVNGRTLTVGIHPDHEILETFAERHRPRRLQLLLIYFKTWLGITGNHWAAFLTGLTHA